MGSLTYLAIIMVISYLVYFTIKEITKPLNSSLKDDIKKAKDKLNKLNKDREWVM